MAKMTITEALADIKTTLARITKKQEGLMTFLARDSRIKDPVPEADGGSREYVRRERQAIGDMEKRVVRIRTAIQASNVSTLLVVLGVEMSVASWLNWRREIAEGQQKFLQRIVTHLAAQKSQAIRQGQGIKAEEVGPSTQGDLIVHVDERQVQQEIDTVTNVLGTLDGKLSLFNATTTIEVD